VARGNICEWISGKFSIKDKYNVKKSLLYVNLLLICNGSRVIIRLVLTGTAQCLKTASKWETIST